MGRYGLERERVAAKLELLEHKKHKVRQHLADICAEAAVLKVLHFTAINTHNRLDCLCFDYSYG